MNEYRYTIEFLTDFVLSTLENGYIPATTIKGALRWSLEKEIQKGKFSEHIVNSLFGNEMDKGKFFISDLKIPDKEKILFTPYININTKFISQFPKLPRGSILKGKYYLPTTLNEHEYEAIKIGFISINQLGKNRHKGFGLCKISIDGLKKQDEFEIIKPPKIITEVSYNILEELNNNIELIYSLDPFEFEKVVEKLLRQFGFSTERTPKTRDGGYDIIALRNNQITGKETYLIECKRYKKQRKIGIDIIRNIYSVVSLNHATKGMIITSSTFSKDAMKFSNEDLNNKIVLHDINKLKTWISKYTNSR